VFFLSNVRTSDKACVAIPDIFTDRHSAPGRLALLGAIFKVRRQTENVCGRRCRIKACENFKYPIFIPVKRVRYGLLILVINQVTLTVDSWNGVREKHPGFVQQGFQRVVACRKMPDNQMIYAGFCRYERGLTRIGMIFS